MTAPDALLLDLDGVLADVERSYRALVVATAATFGVAITRAGVLAATLAGDANNDWRLTQRLLADRGVHVPLDEVTARYQARYLGTDGGPALRETETLIPPLAVVEALAARLPLAVVTGRPRDEAAWFLDREGLAPLIATTVAMEDAPAKPDPAPVRLALDRLGVRAAWMVGDTPDDVRAAVAAGVTAWGVVAPGDDPAAAGAALLAAGATAVLPSLSALLDRLP